MGFERHSGGWFIVLSFVLAFMLTALPLPDWAQVWRPAWVAMTLIYWCLALPQRVGVGVGWTLGLFLDVLSGTLLGQHALGLTVVAYIAHKFHQRVRVLPLWHQATSIFILVLLDQLLATWVRGIQNLPSQAQWVWAPAFTSMLLWPWVFIILRDVRRKHHVS